MNRIVLILVAIATTVILPSLPAFAGGISQQPLGYNVSQGTYAPITGGTVMETGNDIDGYSETVDLPFTFSWNSTDYTAIEIFGDGYVVFDDDNGGGMPGQLPSGDALVSAWHNDLTGNDDGEIRTQTLGDSPNRVFVIQWSNITRAAQGSSEDNYNFQIRLNEATGTASIVYGSMTVTAAVGAQIGARSTGTGDLVFTVSYAFNDWLHPFAGVGLECMALQGWSPASGTTYTVGSATSADARISRVVSPAGKFNANTTQTVKVAFVNDGYNPIDSLQISWAVNGTNRGTFRYYANPSIQPGEEVEVQLGTVNFGAGTFNTITAWTSNPNGVIDQYPGNDMLLWYMAPRVSGRLNLAITGNPGVFPSFKAVVRHLVTSGISGNTNVHVFNGNYNEQILIPQIDNALNGGTVTFQNAANSTPTIVWKPSNYPNGYYGTYEYDFAQATVMEGASVSFDGIKFTLPDNIGWGGNIYGSSVGNVAVKNCRFVGPVNYTTMASPSYVVELDGGPFTVSDNSLTNVPKGLNINGSSGLQDNVIGNTITNFTIEGAIVSSSYVDVNGNKITAAKGVSDNSYGLGVYGAGWLRNNVVLVDVETTEANSTGLGIECVSTYGYNNGVHGLQVYNNMVSVAANEEAVGLTCQPDAGNVVTKLYHNTIYVTGSADADQSVAAYIPGYSPIDIVNNLFYNKGTGANAGYAIYIDDGGNNIVQTMDFNNFMTTGTNVGYFNGDIVRNTVGNPLTAWRTATGKDNNSSSVAVNFLSDSDLHINTIMQALFGSATTIGTVSTDIDGETRIKPYMGADEIMPSVDVLESPQSRYACLGESFQLICVANTTNGAITTYQWYKDGIKLQGSTGSILVMHGVGYPASGSYTCVVQCTDGTFTVSDTSDAASIIVVRPTNIVLQPVSQPVGLGSTVTLSVEAEAIGAPTEFEPVYQWKKHYWSVQSQAYVDTNVVDNGRIHGAKSNRLTISGLIAADTANTYICEIIGYCGTVTSKQAKLYMPMIAASTNTPTACAGGPVNVEVYVIPESIPGSTISYQWYHGNDPVVNSARVTGANGKALRITDATPNDVGDYYCVISFNGVDVVLTSNVVTVELGSTPAVTTQPLGDTLCAGDPLTISISATGGGLRYQWYKGTTSVPGAVSSSYAVQSATAGDAGVYSVVITNPCGTVTSEVVEVVVNSPAAIVTEPTDAAIYDGDTLRMVVTATGAEPISYQWYHDTTMIDGATDSMYVVDSATAETQGYYTCIVTNSCGSDTSLVAIANAWVGVSGDVIADGYALGTAQPNPTNDDVRFTYSIPTPQQVRIVLMNAVGQTVAELLNATMPNGTHTIQLRAAELNLAAGVYTYMIQSGNFVASQQVVVVR